MDADELLRDEQPQSSATARRGPLGSNGKEARAELRRNAGTLIADAQQHAGALDVYRFIRGPRTLLRSEKASTDRHIGPTRVPLCIAQQVRLEHLQGAGTGMVQLSDDRQPAPSTGPTAVQRERWQLRAARPRRT